MNEIVKITWIDAQRLEIGVQDIISLKDVEPIECDIVGFLIYRDEKKTIIAQEKWSETNQAKYIHVIPERSIIKFTVIKEEKDLNEM